jgi:hypothetical protein
MDTMMGTWWGAAHSVCGCTSEECRRTGCHAQRQLDASRYGVPPAPFPYQEPHLGPGFGTGRWPTVEDVAKLLGDPS